MKHERFEWDEKKAEQNRLRHRVTFEAASEALADEDADRFHLEDYDESHSDDEERWLTYCSHPFCRDLVLRVSWTIRCREGVEVTRIISARRASSRGQSEHWKGVQT